MAGFSLITDPNPTVYKTVRIASQAYTIGDAVQLDRVSDAVDVVPATATGITAAIYGVAMSTQVSTDTSLLVCIVTPDQTWSANNTNTVSTNHNQLRAILTDARTVNNTGSDSTSTAAVWQQIGSQAQLSTTRSTGRFLPGYATT